MPAFVPKAGLPLILLLLVLVGCGGSDDQGSEADRQQIEQVVASINSAVAESDARGWCEVFSPTTVSKVFGSSARCQEQTGKVLEAAGAGSADRRLEVAEVKIDGDRAVVIFKGRQGKANFVREGDSWYVGLTKEEGRTIEAYSGD